MLCTRISKNMLRKHGYRSHFSKQCRTHGQDEYQNRKIKENNWEYESGVRYYDCHRGNRSGLFWM
jgi:hypothetical protein